MGVPEEREPCRRGLQGEKSLVGAEDVGVLVEEGTVENGEVIPDHQGASDQILQILQILFREFLGCPADSLGGDGVEEAVVLEFRRDLVVVSPDGGYLRELADPVDHFVGVGTVSDQVSQGDEGVGFQFGGDLQKAGESLQIPVDITEDEIEHSRPSDTPLSP